MSWQRFIKFAERHRLAYGIASAIGVGLLLTVISMSLYISSGASRLDLSRPGYEKARSEVVETKDDDTFSATGPMDLKTIDEFQKLYSSHRTTLSALDSFDSTVMDDTQLRLSPQ